MEAVLCVRFCFRDGLFLMVLDPTTKFSRAFLEALQAEPDADIAAIVRCDHLEPAHEVEAEAAGLVVRRRLRLVQGLAVQGRAVDLLSLASATWVVRIEPDQPVHSLSSGSPL